MTYDHLMLAAVFWAAASLPLAYLKGLLASDIWMTRIEPILAIAPSQPLSIAAWAARTKPLPGALEPWYPPELIAPRVSARREIIVMPYEPAEALAVVMQWPAEIEPVPAETWDQMVLELTGKASCWAAA